MQRTTQPVQSSPASQKPSSSNAPTTKTGHPDRRFSGQRDLPPPEENENYTPARTGGVMDHTHVTLEGKPDKRFAENRSLTDEEVNEKWSENLAAKAEGGDQSEQPINPAQPNVTKEQMRQLQEIQRQQQRH